MNRPLRAPRVDNRLPMLLDEAARLFGSQGFAGTSIRDIVRRVDMLPGSLYYHFAAKEDLLAAVYEEGVRRISERVAAAIKDQVDTPFRVPPGIKLISIDPKSGLRSSGAGTILEAFKPGTAPPDSYSVIGGGGGGGKGVSISKDVDRSVGTGTGGIY